MSGEPSIVPRAERWARVVAAVAAVICGTWLGVFTWRTSEASFPNTRESAAGLIIFGVFVSAGVIVCLDLRSRAAGIVTRRWFGGPWSQLLMWNLWNGINTVPMGVSTWLGRLGVAMWIALWVLLLLGRELQGRASAGPDSAADLEL